MTTPSSNGNGQANGLHGNGLFAMVPLEIAARKDLSLGAKLLFGIINSLQRASLGRCVAGNDELAERIGESNRQTRRWIHELEERQLIARDLDHGRRQELRATWKPSISGINTHSRTPQTTRRSPVSTRWSAQTTEKTLEKTLEKKSSSSSTPPPAEKTTTTTFASLPKNKSGGSKQEARPLSDAEGREMVRRVASKCPHLPGAAAKFQAAPELPRRCGHDWRGLANQVVRLEEQVAAGDIKFRTIENPVNYVVGMLKKLPLAKLSAAELAGYQATVERLLKPAPASPPRPRKDAGPDHTAEAEIAERERELPELEAEVANEPNPTAKRCKQRALNQAREELAALKNARHGEGQSHLAFSATH